jgi:hypothetical protein
MLMFVSTGKFCRQEKQIISNPDDLEKNLQQEYSTQVL